MPCSFAIKYNPCFFILSVWFRDKRRNLIMVIVAYLIMTGMIIMDIISRLRGLRKLNDTLTKDRKRNLIFEWKKTQKIYVVSRWKWTFLLKFVAAVNIHIESYFPFYLQYFILMTLHIQFAQTALGVQRRYYRLNLAIRNIFSISKIERQLQEF